MKWNKFTREEPPNTDIIWLSDGKQAWLGLALSYKFCMDVNKLYWRWPDLPELPEVEL